MSKRPFFQRYSLTPVGPGGVRIALSLVALSVAALSVAALALTVGGGPEPVASEAAPAASAAVASPLAGTAPAGDIPAGQSVPFDIGAIIEQVHFAYAPEGHDFVAGHTTYGVRVIDGTSVAIRPYHFPAGQDEGLEPARGSRHKDGRRNHRRAPRVPAIEGEPLELETVALERGGIPIEADETEASPRVAQDGSLEIPRFGALERLRNHDEGVEQSWSFAERPEGDGDLVVSVAVSGQEPVGETEEGLHFEDPDTGLGSRYGLVAWIDANGDQTDVPIRYHDGLLTLTVPEALLEVSAYPATVNATVSGELGTDNPVAVIAPFGQNRPDVAYGGGVFLVCWDDTRQSSRDIFCARVKGGSLLDIGGIPVCTAPDDQYEPSVAFDGSSFAVIWEDRRNSQDTDSSDLYGARVSVTASITPFIVSQASGDQFDASIAFNGSKFLAVWLDTRLNDEPELYGVLFQPSGSMSSTLVLATTTAYPRNPDVACDETNCLVVWDDRRNDNNIDIYARSVSASGARGTPFAIQSTVYPQEFPAVAFAGGTYLVAWRDYAGDSGDIYAARVSTDFVVSPVSIVSAAAGVQTAPAIAFDSVASRFLVVWQDRRNSSSETDIYGSRVNFGGVVDANFPISTAADDQTLPAVAFDGSCMLVAWTSLPSTDIFGTRVCSRTVATASLVSSAANDQFASAVAFDGTNYMVVWEDYRSGRPDVYGTRVSPSGTVLNTSGIKVAVGSSDQYQPDLACDGTNCLVCWHDSFTFDIYCARVASATGTVIDTLGFELSTGIGGDEPALAFDGTNYLVVWTSSSSDVYGSFVSRSASVRAAPGNISGALSGDQSAPDVAFDPINGNYLVVWQDRRSGTSYDIYGALVSKTADVVKSIIYHPTAGEQTVPTVAFAGSNFMVVWEDTRNGNPDLYGARVTGTNTLSAGLTLMRATNEQEHPSIASDGTSYLLVYQDKNTSSGTWDVRALRLDSDGSIADATSISTSTSVDEMRPVVACGPEGNAYVAYDRFDESASRQSNRVKARIVIY